MSDAAFAELDKIHGYRLPDGAMSQSLLLAASLPDDDFDAFRIATAILLADRLQNGAIEDNLFWYWDAFQSHYALLPTWQSAAIMNGFTQAHLEGLVELYDPPEVALRQSRNQRTLQGIIDSARPEAAAVLRTPQDVFEAAPALGQTLWEIFTTAYHPARRDPALAACLRHIYETNLEFDPVPGRHFDVSHDLPPTIPQALPD